MTQVTVKEARMYEEKGSFYIDVTYTIENDHCTRVLNIPKVRIPLENGEIVNNYLDAARSKFYSCYLNEAVLRCSDDCLLSIEKVWNCGCGVYWTEKTIEEKPVDMTVEEIEKKLGYKINIVSKSPNETNK